MPFHELSGRQRAFCGHLFPATTPEPCEECGRRDYKDWSATDDSDPFFEDNENLMQRFHELVAHDYVADITEAMLEVVRAGLEDEGALLGILGELALSFYGLGLQHARTGQVGTVGVPVTRQASGRN